MAHFLNLSLALILALALGACSSGSSSSGGGAADATTTGTTTTGTTTTGTSAGDTKPGSTTTPTYSEKDLTGNWNYIVVSQPGGLTCTGTMALSGTRLTGYTNSCCPDGRQLIQGEFWIWSDGYVKGRNYAWCADTQEYAKFSMNFVSGSNKNRITGLMDLHLDPRYERFDITMSR